MMKRTSLITALVLSSTVASPALEEQEWNSMSVNARLAWAKGQVPLLCPHHKLTSQEVAEAKQKIAFASKADVEQTIRDRCTSESASRK